MPKNKYSLKNIIYKEHLRTILRLLNTQNDKFFEFNDIKNFLIANNYEHTSKQNIANILRSTLITNGLIFYKKWNKYKITKKGIKLLEIYDKEKDIEMLYKTIQ